VLFTVGQSFAESQNICSRRRGLHRELKIWLSPKLPALGEDSVSGSGNKLMKQVSDKESLLFEAFIKNQEMA
jgi:hypothetical protein